jgi:hypothetical protein
MTSSIGPVSRFAVRLATGLLPHGDVRWRYRAELGAELAALRPLQRCLPGLTIVLAAPSLHRSLVESGALPFAHSPLWCRARLRHEWHTTSTDDGRLYRRCVACGLDDDGTMDSRRFGGYGVTMHGTHSG